MLRAGIYSDAMHRANLDALAMIGAPLHPLARGKLAVRNDCELFDWPGLLECF